MQSWLLKDCADIRRVLPASHLMQYLIKASTPNACVNEMQTLEYDKSFRNNASCFFSTNAKEVFSVLG